MKLPTYRNFSCYFFYDVLTALARVRLIKENIAHEFYQKKKELNGREISPDLL